MAEQKKRVYQSTTLGMPALKMVLVHARNEAQNKASRRIQPPSDTHPAGEEVTPQDTQKAVRKIIEHLESLEG